MENIGNASLAFTGLSVSANFVQVASGGTDCSSSTNLAVDDTCEIAIAFEPTAGGSLSGDVTVTSGAFDIPLSGTGNGPDVSLNPTSLSFGNQTVSTTSTAKTITLTNSGNQTLTISSISIVGTNSGDFSQTNNCGSSLSASSNCTISVTFTPSATGSRSASISVSDNATGSPQTVALTGTGTGMPQISFSPTSWSFGNQVVSTSSTAESITVTNPGNATLTISGITITGTNSGDFSQTNNCSSVAAGSGSCTIQVTFTPSATGSRSASISVTDNASGSPHTVALSGTGTAPQISFSPTSWSFGNQLINTNSTAESITVTNPGTATLTISGISITGTNSGDFSQTNNCSTAAAGSGSCTIQVTFTPSASGSRSASISVTDSSSGSPHTIALSGTGTAPQISFSPTSWTFGNQLVNGSSRAESITVTNPGTATLTISAVSITGTDSGDFSQTNNCSTVAAGSGSCTIQVTFTPSASGSRSASISVTDSASGSPHTFALTGTGTAPQTNFSTSSWSFGNQVIATSSTSESITVTNPGSALLTISAVSITGTNSGDFSQTNNCSTVAAGSGSCTIQVTFTPSATGSRSASISVADNASGSPQTVTLSGTGVAPQIGLTPASLTFSSQALKTTSAGRSITLSNPGSSALVISSIAVGGTNAGDFSQTNNCATIAPAGTCTVSLSYTPSVLGSEAANLQITDNAGGSPQTIGLNGTGIVTDNPTLSIDYPSSLTGPIEGVASINGWAVDKYFAISAVNVAVDGSQKGAATYGASRPDVCQTLTSSVGCPDVGWTFVLDTGLLSNGSHSLSVIAVTSDGRSASASVSFTVANWSSSGNAVTIGIDKPAVSAPSLTGISSVGGWVVGQGAAISTVQISVDGVQYGTASYGGVRSDVCVIYPNAVGCPNVGWNYSLNTHLLADGTHTLAVTATTAGGQSSTSTRSFTVSNAAAGSSTRISIGYPNAQTGALSGSIGIGGWALDAHSTITEVDVLVDGVELGQARYGGLRTDVCTVYTGSPGCPGVGWNYVLNTTQLTDSSHSLQIRATTTAGEVTTVSTQFTVFNKVTAARVCIDDPGPKDGAYQGLVYVAGWALDDDAAISRVTITVDGVPLGNASYGTARADVCAAYPGRRGCPNVGWNLLLNTSQLANGTHVLGATASTTDGRTATANTSFTVANWASSTGSNSMHLDIDSPSSKSGALTGTAHLGGWAIDDYAAIAAVQVAVDNVPYGTAIYGTVRNDVCTAYANRAGCPNVGWDYLLDTTLLSDGSHTLAITGVSTGGQTSTIMASFTVGNLPKMGVALDIDVPAGSGETTLQGSAIISGWAIDNSAPVANIEVFVDNNLMGNANYGTIRPDVCTVFPKGQGCPDVGWNFRLDTTQLTNGKHTLNITAATTAGQRGTVGQTFSVGN